MFKKIRDYFTLALSISGFVPKHATFLRSAFMLSGLVFSMRLMRLSKSAPVNPYLFFLSTSGAYFGFIYSILSKGSLRHQFTRKFATEKEAYLAYEAILGFLFFMNGTSMGYISAARQDTLPVRVNKKFLQPVAALLFLAGWTVKVWSAKVVGSNIYYWKDMFYDRKITDFAEEGPYKVLRNPMYGVGQLQTYATALWYRSLPGLLAAVFY
jgi:protein-S-isoprenylcysteine O-methyltransferase Ste14